MIIKILGSGCKKCVALGDNVYATLKTTGREAEIVKVTDVVDIAGYGVMSTPGLVIDEEVVSVGKILTEVEIAELLRARQP